MAGDGRLDESEIAALATRLGKRLNDKELKAAMEEMDDDGDGTVDCGEFEKWWTTVPPPSPPPLPARPLCAAGTCSGALRCGTQTGIKLLRKAKTSRMRTMEGTIAEVIGEVTVQGDDAVRNRSTEQIMRLTKTMEGMSTTQLKLLFDALVRALAAQRPMRLR